MPRSSPFSQRHLDQRVSGNTDQAEFAALRFGSAVVTAGIYDNRLEGNLDYMQNPFDRTPIWEADDIAADNALVAIQDEVGRREAILKAAYPFTLENGVLLYSNPSSNFVYEFLLAASMANNLSAGAFAEIPRQFERVVSELVAHWLGASRVVHTGFPRDEKVGRRFDVAMRRASEMFTEPRWQPQEDLPAEPGGGDQGVDFIVCRTSPDNRPIGQLFLLGQCACGNDWSAKLKELSVSGFKKWFHPFSLVEPVRVFAMPHLIGDGWLKEASREAGLVFDRARLTSIAADKKAAALIRHQKRQMERLVQVVQRQD